MTTTLQGRLRALLQRQEGRLGLAMAALFVALAFTAPGFFTAVNLASVVRGMGVLTIVSMGMLMVILTGGIDVSVGSMVAVISVVAARWGNTGAPAALVAPGALLLGAGLGFFNAVLIADLRIPPIVATLGTMGLYRGLLLQWTQGEWVTRLPDWLAAAGRPGRFLMDGSVWAAVVVTVLTAWFLRRTQAGRSLFRFGGSPIAARRIGIAERRVVYLTYSLMGVLSAVGALFYAAQLGSVQGNAALGYELTVIAAVVLGGANIMGGEGSVTGTLLGVVLLGSIQSALILLHVPTFWQGVVTGVIVLLGVAAGAVRRRHPIHLRALTGKGATA